MLLDSAFISRIGVSYDIRSSKIENEDAEALGKAFGSEVIDSFGNNLVVGYDRRLKSQEFAHSFVKGVLSTGCNVYFVGKVGTPVVQVGEVILNAQASVSITASHNPLCDHGFKFFLQRKPFSGINLQKMVKRIPDSDFKKGKGKLIEKNILGDYAFFLSKKLFLEGKFKVGWDLLNGSAGDSFPKLAKLLNGKHFVINHDNKKNFGGLSPDPTNPERRKDIQKLMKENDLDIGFGIDGDADRCVVFNKKGEIISGDLILGVFAYISAKYFGKKNKIIWDSKSSNALIRTIKSMEQSCFVAPTGHSNIVQLMHSKNADIAGETSGHYMFQDRYFGFSDGIYSAMRLLSDLEASGITLEDVLSYFPPIWISSTHVIPCDEEKKDILIAELHKHVLREGVTVDTTDGIKACYSDGWWLVRSSNTEPILRVRYEGWSEAALENMKDRVRVVLATIGYDL